MTKNSGRKNLYDGKPIFKIPPQKLKEIEEKSVYIIWYTDEHGDEITSYWSSQKLADLERKKLLEHGHTVSEVFKR